VEGDETTTGSEDDQGAGGNQQVPGAADDGARGDQNSEALRNLQQQRDRQAAEIAKLKQDLAAATKPANSDTPTEATPLSAEGVMALLRRDREMTSAVSQLKSDFPLADEAIFTGYDSFESVEAFRAAAEMSHGRIKSLVDAQVEPQLQAAVEAALKPYIEKYGRLASAPSDNGGATATGLPSAEEVKGYSMSQLEDLVAQHGDDVIDRILRSSLTEQ
jgi:hypothetical protein